MASTTFDTRYTTPIQGGYASGDGGFISILQNDPNSNIPAIRTVTTSIDVALWAISQIFEHSPLYCSGNVGAADSKQIAYSYLFRALVVWNFQTLPETAMRGIEGCELTFNMGALKKNQYGEEVDPRYYWTPDAVIEKVTPILDVNGKKMARSMIQGHCRSHLFAIPDMGDPDDQSTIAGAYNKWYFG